MEYVSRAKHLCAELGIELDPQSVEAVAQVRTRPTAVLIRSPVYGQVWVVLEDRTFGDLAAEEATRNEPRPVIHLPDLLHLGQTPVRQLDWPFVVCSRLPALGFPVLAAMVRRQLC